MKLINKMVNEITRYRNKPENWGDTISIVMSEESYQTIKSENDYVWVESPRPNLAGAVIDISTTIKHPLYVVGKYYRG